MEMGYDWSLHIGLESKPANVNTYEEFANWCEKLSDETQDIGDDPDMVLLEIIGRKFHGSGDLVGGGIDPLKRELEMMSELEMCKDVEFRIYHTYWDRTMLTIYDLCNGKIKHVKSFNYETKDIIIDHDLNISMRIIFTGDVIRSVVRNNISYFFNYRKQRYYEFNYTFFDDI